MPAATARRPSLTGFSNLDDLEEIQADAIRRISDELKRDDYTIQHLRPQRPEEPDDQTMRLSARRPGENQAETWFFYPNGDIR